jgi:hypothetical protein
MRVTWDFSELHEFVNDLSDPSVIDTYLKKATKDIARAALKHIKSLTPVDTYELINAWNKNKLAVVKKEDGFEVLLVNDTEYASAVNDGHKSYNQYGGPYPIKNRVQVRTPHRWQKGDPTYYVFGHFFVERGLIQTKNTKEIESIILRELNNLWRNCGG